MNKVVALLGVCVAMTATADNGPIIDGYLGCHPVGEPQLAFVCPEGQFCCSMPVYGSPPWNQVTAFPHSCCDNGSACKAQRQGDQYVTMCTTSNPGGGD